MKKSIIIGIVVRVLFAMIFIALGAWAIQMALAGETPAQKLDKPGDPVIMGIFGSMFVASGVMGIAYAFLARSAAGRKVVAVMMTGVCLLFGACFLSVAILQPEEIESSSSINGIEISRKKGGWGGAIAFTVVGLLPIIFVRQVYRASKKTLDKAARKEARLRK